MQDQLGQPQNNDQKSHMTMLIVGLGFMFVWMNIAPKLFPGMFPVAKKPVVEVTPDLAQAAVGTVKAEDLKPIAEFPDATVDLGGLQADGKFYLLARVNSRGGTLESVALNDPRYTTLNRSGPLKVIGNNLDPGYPGGQSEARSFETVVDQIEAQLQQRKLSLATVNWEVVESDAEHAVLRYPSPDGSLVATKTYRVHEAPADQRDTAPLGYIVDLSIKLENKAEKELVCRYSLRGPTGVVIENEHNARTFLEAKVGTVSDPTYPDSVTAIIRSASLVVDQYTALEGGKVDAIDIWREPIRYAGIDSQFFTAMLKPKGDQFIGEGPDRKAYFSEIKPIVVSKATLPERSDIGLMFESSPLKLSANGVLTHDLQLYFGPKRRDLLEPVGAYAALDHGWFARIMAGMLGLLKFFHSFGAPYGVAIIMLTCVVRFCMFPLSRIQTKNQNKMTRLQPKIKELQDKYKDEPIKFAMAQREFFGKYDYNPYTGCLLMIGQLLFIQMPIFMALYNALYYAVDLRLAKFLWINSLAAPDATATLGFNLPFLGNEFNILPIINVCLFLVQQKMMTPPAVNEEQAMQQKMMKFMTVIMGVMFYKVPSGLCIYFIASSLWGILERKYLERLKGTLPTLEQMEKEAEERVRSRPTTPVVIDTTGTVVTSIKPKTWIEKLMTAADEAKHQTDAQKSRKDRK